MYLIFPAYPILSTEYGTEYAEIVRLLFAFFVIFNSTLPVRS
jgi:hypothetical protein